MGPVDELELVVPPLRPLGALVLAVADLERLRLERLLGARGREDELDHLPVALVEVVPVVEGIEEPVLEREPIRVGRVGRDMGVDRRLRVGGHATSPALVVAAGAQRVARKVEVVLVEALAEVLAGRRDLDEIVALPGPAERDGLLVEERVDVARPEGLARAAFLPLLDEANDGGVPLGEVLLGVRPRHAGEGECNGYADEDWKRAHAGTMHFGAAEGR